MRPRHLLLAVAALLTFALPAFAQIGTTFTVQGYLRRDGLAYDGNVDLELRVFDAASAGAQVGPTLTQTSVPVHNGLFTEELDFGAIFDGTSRWLDVAVQAPGDAGFTALEGRIAILPSPYAMFAAGGAGGGFSPPILADLAVPGATSGSDPLAGTALLEMRNSAGVGLSHGIVGRTSSTAQNAVGVLGVGEATSGYTNGVQGLALGSSLGTGVVGIGNANGGYFRGENPTGNGVQGVTTSGNGVYGDAYDGTGLYGHAATGTGVYGQSDHPGAALGVGGTGVYGLVRGSNGSGVYGRNESSSSSGQGVFGHATGHAFGVLAVSEGSDGLSARTNASGKSAVAGFAGASGAYGGYFSGVNGSTALRADGLGKQLKLADARQAAFAVVIGPDDRARGEVQLKDLHAKTQRAVPASALVAELRAARAT